MFAPIYTTLQASATVRSLFGARPRIYAFGEAPADPQKPYGVFRFVSMVPDLTLGETPAVERQTVQLDLYDSTQQGVAEAATAVRDQLETVCHVTNLRNYPREEAARSFRIGIDADYWLGRES